MAATEKSDRADTQPERWFRGREGKAKQRGLQRDVTRLNKTTELDTAKHKMKIQDAT